MKPWNYGSKPKPAIRTTEERDELVLNNLDIPRKTVRVMWGTSLAVRRLGWDDAVQTMTLVMLRAAETWDECKGEFRPYATAACFRSLRGLAVRQINIITVKTAGKRAPVVLTAGDEHRTMLAIDNRRNRSPEVAEEETDYLDEVRDKVESVLARMPPGQERDWMERRLEGLSRFETWAALGRPRRSLESIECRALQMARKIAKAG